MGPTDEVRPAESRRVSVQPEAAQLPNQPGCVRRLTSSPYGSSMSTGSHTVVPVQTGQAAAWARAHQPEHWANRPVFTVTLSRSLKPGPCPPSGTALYRPQLPTEAGEKPHEGAAPTYWECELRRTHAWVLASGQGRVLFQMRDRRAVFSCSAEGPRQPQPTQLCLGHVERVHRTEP